MVHRAQEALVQRQATEGAGTPAVASSMMQLAVVYDAVDQPTAAVSMYTRAASVLEAIYSTTPDMCPPLSAMGGMLMRRNQCAETVANPTYEEQIGSFGLGKPGVAHDKVLDDTTGSLSWLAYASLFVAEMNPFGDHFLTTEQDHQAAFRQHSIGAVSQSCATAPVETLCPNSHTLCSSDCRQ
jgi:hypothetical protein